MNTMITKLTTGHSTFSLASTVLSALFLLCSFLPVLSFGFLSGGFVSLSFFAVKGHPALLAAFIAGFISLFLSVLKLQRFVFLPAFISFGGVLLTLALFMFTDSMRNALAMPVALMLIVIPLALMINSFLSWRTLRHNHSMSKVTGRVS